MPSSMAMLLAAGSLVFGPVKGEGDWSPCNRADCTCAGVCLSPFRGRAFEAIDAQDGNMTYQISLCDALPADKPPAEGGTQGCDGCDGSGPGRHCTVVRDREHTLPGGEPDRECMGLGSAGGCTGSSFPPPQCGMEGRRNDDGSVSIRYTYSLDMGGESVKDTFTVKIKHDSTDHVSKVTFADADEAYSATLTTRQSVECSAPVRETMCARIGDDGEYIEASKFDCGDSSLRPGADEMTGRDAGTCCCAGSRWLIVPYCVFMCYMFVGLAIVCEEYFVPSLNVLCEKLQIPDDIAGATFMAAGASSPEMFAALIGVVDGSAVGAGTVVGSELFNMLVIVGAVCLFSQSGLVLDWRPLVREVGFFMASLFLLIWVLADEEIEMWEATALVLSYGGYVIVCAKYGFLVKLICPMKASDTSESGGLEGPLLAEDEVTSVNASKNQRVTMDGSMFGLEYGEVIMHSFLFKSSRYYTKIRMSGSKWQRRWFILTDEDLRYCKNPLFAARHSSRSIPIKTATAVKRNTPTEFELVTPAETYTFKAQKPEMAEAWVSCLETRLEDIQRESQAQQAAAASQQQSVEEHPSVLAWPETSGRRALYMVTFPMLLILYATIPDVRRQKWTDYYPVTMITGVGWLAIMAYGMMNAAERAGCLAGLQEDLMGLTVTAAGTSLPNLFASVLVARQGLGNMAVSNAFGSNTFNIFIALGFPWFIGTIINGTCKDAKADRTDDTVAVDPNCGLWQLHVDKGNIFGSCLILVGVLTLFLFALGMTKMKLTPLIGAGYLVVYGIFIFYLCISTLYEEYRMPF